MPSGRSPALPRRCLRHPRPARLPAPGPAARRAPPRTLRAWSVPYGPAAQTRVAAWRLLLRFHGLVEAGAVAVGHHPLLEQVVVLLGQLDAREAVHVEADCHQAGLHGADLLVLARGVAGVGPGDALGADLLDAEADLDLVAEAQGFQ